MIGDVRGITTNGLKKEFVRIIQELIDRGEIHRVSSTKSIYDTGSVSEIRWKGAFEKILEKPPDKPVTMQITICPTCRTKLAEWGQRGEGNMYIKCPNCRDIYELHPVFGAEPRLVKKYQDLIEITNQATQGREYMG